MPTAPARALGFLYVGGAALGALTVLVDRRPETSLSQVLALCALAVVVGGALLARPRSFDRGWLDGLCALGTLILGAGCVIAGPNPYGVMFLWTGLFAAGYLPRTAPAHLALIGVVLAGAFALADHGAEQPVAAWLIMIGALGLSSVLIAQLLDRLEDQQARVLDRATRLSRSENRLRAMLETAQDGFLALDPDGRIVDCNARFAAMIGRARHEVLRRPFAQLALPEEGWTAHDERRAALIAGNVFDPYETRFVRADGTTFPALVSGGSMQVAGEPLVVKFVRDLSLREERERERRIAATLQRTLLPQRLPRIAGVELAARYVPAASEAGVGGDWYDAVELPGGRLALAMGDVAGKGLAAAASVGQLRSGLRAYALEHGDPGTVLDRLEAAILLEEGEDSDLTTLVLAVVDVEARSVHWASAGHPPPLLVDGEGGARWLEQARTAPVGAGAPGRRLSAETTLPDDATLVLYTDGLIERRDSPLQAGLERLRVAAADAAADGPDAVVDRALERAGVAQGGPDDVAMLAVRVRPIGARMDLELSTRPEELARLRAALRRWLEEHERADADLVLAATEAATNAVEHTRGEAAGTFGVAAWLQGDEVVVEVTSAGGWRRRDGARRHRGRGLTMMRALVDELDVHEHDGATTVRLLRRAAP